MNRSAFKSYPHLTEEEFGEACHFLDRRYCRATLGAVRKQWRLSVHSALNVAYGASPDFVTYLQITRPLDQDGTDEDLAAHMERFALSQSDEDHGVVEMETSDAETLSRPQTQQGRAYVRYEIHHHPVYRAPCLWFSLHDLPPDDLAFSIDTVFRRLVPEAFKSSLRGLGSVGGISADVGLISHLPCRAY